MQTNETQVVPATPIRKLLYRLSSLRRKRSRRTSSSRSVSEGDVRITPTWSYSSPSLRRPPNGNLGAKTPTHVHYSNALSQHKHAQLAIQQHDRVHDAIVVSTLPYYPFCCHQDLLAMGRPRLVQTAYLFNSCLPFSTRFADLEVSSDAYIRHRIEKLVGIVSGPTDGIQTGSNDIKANPDSLAQCELDTTITPPSSPLAMYPTRRRGMLSSPRYLGVLVEEDENEFSSCRRTLKSARSTVEASQVSFDRRSWYAL